MEPDEVVTHVEVTVPTPDADPTPPATESDTIVVTGNDTDAVDAVIVEQAIDSAVQLSQLQTAVAELAVNVAEAVALAQQALNEISVWREQLDELRSQVSEATAEPQAKADDDETPTHEHPWFKTPGSRE